MKLNSVKDIIDNISVIENVGCGYGNGDGDGINQLMVKSLVDDNVILKSRYDNYISFLRK